MCCCNRRRNNVASYENAGNAVQHMAASAGSDCREEHRCSNAAVTLALDWYPNANDLGLFIAQEKGYFQRENLTVTLYTPVDPSTVLQPVAAVRLRLA